MTMCSNDGRGPRSIHQTDLEGACALSRRPDHGRVLLHYTWGARLSSLLELHAQFCSLLSPLLPSQMNQILEVGSRKEGARRYTALDKWAAQISSLHAAVHNKLAVVG